MFNSVVQAIRDPGVSEEAHRDSSAKVVCFYGGAADHGSIRGIVFEARLVEG